MGQREGSLSRARAHACPRSPLPPSRCPVPPKALMADRRVGGTNGGTRPGRGGTHVRFLALWVGRKTGGTSRSGLHAGEAQVWHRPPGRDRRRAAAASGSASACGPGTADSRSAAGRARDACWRREPGLEPALARALVEPQPEAREVLARVRRVDLVGAREATSWPTVSRSPLRHRSGTRPKMHVEQVVRRIVAILAPRPAT
jgi:hypothetical protein